MINIESVELHDALIKNLHIDYVKENIVIDVEFYQNENDRNRIPMSIEFHKVETISQISDFKRLQKNAFAGNINYWIPDLKGGTTYIYLSDGCLAIKAGKVLCTKFSRSHIARGNEI